MIYVVQTRKRRIYDVTNVLEGVGLIEKVGTNNVRWVPPHEASPLSTVRFRRIHQQRLDELDKLQQSMEGSIEHLQRCIESLTSAASEEDLLYVSQQDIAGLDSLKGCASNEMGVKDELHVMPSCECVKCRHQRTMEDQQALCTDCMDDQMQLQ